jgi:flagellar hook-associated protein 1 FlgK
MTVTSSIGGIMSTATTGLSAAQVGLSTTSDNVANANTTGYVRKIVSQSSLVNQGTGAGVTINGIRRVTDAYLESAGLTATSTSNKAGVLSSMLDQAQSMFGNPSDTNGYFSKLSDVFTQFAALANNPSSSLQKGQSLESLQTFFDDTTRVASSLSDQKNQADTQIQSDVGRVNDLLTQIAKLNGDISKAHVTGADSSGSENIQAQQISELSGLLDVQVTTGPDGASVVRTPDGMLLADKQAGKVTYNQSTTAANFLTVTTAAGGGQTFDASFNGGEITGLLQMRNVELPNALAQLSQFAQTTAGLINQAHNANSASPPPATLTGKNTGLDLPTAVSGFSGQTTLALIDSAGVTQHKLAIDFGSPGGISLDGGAATTFTPSTFLATLNSTLGANGSATFTNGALTLNAVSGGVAVVDDPTTPSQKAGQGFSQFFGLNDLVKSTSFNPNTGLSAGDTSGFTAGQQITFRLSQDNGTRVRDVAFTVPAGTTMGALVTALNATGTGVAPYGSFALDSNGKLAFSSATSPSVSLSVVSDTTSRGAGGPAMSQFFGLGTANLAANASGYSVNPAINQNPALLATARVNLSAAAGVVSISPGDGTGAAALANAGDRVANFSAAGGLPAGSMTLARYASEFAGALGRKAAAADTASTSADAVKAEANSRLSSFEGVNMDEELVNLTKYQQAFNASARMITAASQMYDTLLAMVH